MGAGELVVGEWPLLVAGEEVGPVHDGEAPAAQEDGDALGRRPAEEAEPGDGVERSGPRRCRRGERREPFGDSEVLALTALCAGLLPRARTGEPAVVGRRADDERVDAGRVGPLGGWLRYLAYQMLD